MFHELLKGSNSSTNLERYRAALYLTMMTVILSHFSEYMDFWEEDLVLRDIIALNYTGYTLKPNREDKCRDYDVQCSLKHTDGVTPNNPAQNCKDGWTISIEMLGGTGHAMLQCTAGTNKEARWQFLLFSTGNFLAATSSLPRKRGLRALFRFKISSAIIIF